MSTTTTARITYRKTKQGEWVAYGPAAEFFQTIGDRTIRRNYVTVTKRSGEADLRAVERTGRIFTVAGVEMVYGYLERDTGCHTDDDHEDCLSVGPCGPTCEYAFLGRKAQR